MAEISSQSRLLDIDTDRTLIEQGKFLYPDAYENANGWVAGVKMVLWLDKKDGSGLHPSSVSGESIQNGDSSTKMVRCTLRVAFGLSSDKETRDKAEGLVGWNFTFQRWDMVLNVLVHGIELGFNKDGKRKHEDEENELGRGIFSEKFVNSHERYIVILVTCING